MLKQFSLSDLSQTLLLAPVFMLGCTAFEVRRRQPIKEAITMVKAYTQLRNAKNALEVLEEVWSYMDAGSEKSWDRQGIASDIGMGFLAT